MNTVCSHQLTCKSARKQRSNLNKKGLSIYILLLPKIIKTVFAFCTNKNPKTQKKSVACVYRVLEYQHVNRVCAVF